LNNGEIIVGKGEDFGKREFIRWKDLKPIRNIKYVGFSSWDTPIQIRKVIVRPFINFNEKLTQNMENQNNSKIQFIQFK
jgi:hypothetical protein